MVTLMIIASLFFFPVDAHALVFSDPVAAAQRKISLWYDSLEATRMVQLIQQQIQNYQAAKLTYDLAKAGYEKATNPEEWKALTEYGRYRLKTLSQPTTDPYQASLFQTMLSLDRAADAYMANTRLYGAMATAGAGVGEGLARADRRAAGQLSERAPDFLAIQEAADWKAFEWGTEASLRDFDNSARRYLAQSVHESASLQERLLAIRARAEQLAEELAKLRKMEFYAEQGYQLALQKSQKPGLSPEKAKAAALQLEQAGRIKEDIAARIKRVQEEMELLNREVQGLTAEIENNNQKIDANAAALGFEAAAKDLVENSSLAKGAQSESNVQAFRTTAFTILLISLSLAILWKGINVFNSAQGDAIPHQAVFGLIGAILFLLPTSPLRIDRVARDMAILVDATETTMFKATVDKAKARWSTGFSQVLGTITNEGAAGATTNEKVLEEWKRQMKKMGENSSTGVIGGIKSLIRSPLGVGSSLSLALLQGVGVIVSFVGVLAVMQSFALREIAYWVLMTVAPLMIALAPLDVGRKKLLPGWGMSLYAVILWGPITKSLLMLSNSRAFQTLDIVRTAAESTTTYPVLVGFYEGVVLILLMLFSPFIAYKLAQGSFDGLIGALGAAGVGAVAATAYAGGKIGQATASVGKALPGMAKGTGWATQAIGKVMSKVGGRQSGGGGPLMPRATPLTSRALTNVGKGLQAAGQFMMKSASAVGNYTQPRGKR